MGCHHELGMAPVKINTVVLKGINDNEIISIAALTRRFPFHIRFIEYMPMTRPWKSSSKY